MASIPIADVITTERLPIDAQDIVTKVRLVIAGNRAGIEAEEIYAFPSDEPLSYFAWPITHVYQAPEHATYGAERSLALPEGFNPFLAPDDTEGIPEPTTVENFNNPGTPSAIRDGDPVTYAEYNGAAGGTGQIAYPSRLDTVGFYLRYEYAPQNSASANHILRLAVFNGGVLGTGYAVRRMGATTGVNELYMIFPSDARFDLSNGSPLASDLRRGSASLISLGTASCRVYAFYPLRLDRELLNDVAKANIRLPAANPTRVTVKGYVAPDRSHTIVGWPGGDYTGVVAQHQYELGRTIIDFEQAGAPIGLPAEAIEAARERTAAVKSELQRSGYSLKMGERQ